MPVTTAEFLQMQSLPLRLKIKKTEQRIIEWSESHSGMIYGAFSGGIGSTALMHIARGVCPYIPAVYCNTGQDLPQVREFALTMPNLTVIRPEHSYKWVIDHHGYPVVSKEVSKNISRCRRTKSETQRQLRLWGGINPTSGKVQKTGVIPKKYHYLVNAPFEISDKCCEILKKNPFKKYDKESGRVPMTGEMAVDSNKRRQEYLKHGCNYYGKKHKSTPMGFWTRQDLLEYIVEFSIPYASVYGKIIKNPETGLLETTGERSTGCSGCMFSLQMQDPNNNHFTRMRQTDPILWNIYVNTYKQGEVMDFMGVNYR
jgi:3'-phosphoadenosine 5'-phosphosulfate sulfotransferase (PAPS reductase)/FAD synthetase